MSDLRFESPDQSAACNELVRELRRRREDEEILAALQVCADEMDGKPVQLEVLAVIAAIRPKASTGIAITFKPGSIDVRKV